MWAMIGTAIVTLAVTMLVYHLEKREKQRRAVWMTRTEGEDELRMNGHEKRGDRASPIHSYEVEKGEKHDLVQ